MIPWTRLRAHLGGRRGRRLAELAEEVAGHWPHLPTLEAHIRESIQQVERAVSDVCGAFGGMVTRARESVAAASELLGSDKGSGIQALLGASRHTLAQLQQQIERSREISAQVIGHMQRMESTAGVIVKALGEIDRISFGSKLVALNAKVEAARFGEEGMAFGVVADEIAAHALRSEQITSQLVEEMKQLRSRVAEASLSLNEMAGLSMETLESSRGELERALGELTRTHAAMEATLAASAASSQQLADEIARSVIALQFQDRVSQRLSHVADELAEMRNTVHVPLEYLARETPVLGQARRQAVEARLKARYTMQSEREVLGSKQAAEESEQDGVELF
jgi:methyl-accepting chemotaxis protein